MQVAPSILNANFAHLQAEIDSLQSADRIHLDIMDGQYVPNLTFGASILHAIDWKNPIEAHLMCDDPEALFDAFIALGCETITFHIENTGTEKSLANIEKLCKSGINPGIAIDAYTAVSSVDPRIFEAVDQVILMAVKAGFGGQKFMPEVVEKVRKLREMGYEKEIEIDGGISPETAPIVAKAGADVVVMGSALMKKPAEKRAEIIRQVQAL